MAGNLSFLLVSKEWLKVRLEVLARRKLLSGLRERCEWDFQNPEAGNKKGRKDMYAISPELDWHACTVQIRREPVGVKSIIKDLPVLDAALTNRQVGILKTIQEGSIRTGHRLVHGTLESPYCYRCAKRGLQILETAVHVFWDCLDVEISEIREIFLPVIKRQLDRMGLLYVDGADQGVDLKEYPPFF